MGHAQSVTVIPRVAHRSDGSGRRANHSVGSGETPTLYEQSLTSHCELCRVSCSCSSTFVQDTPLGIPHLRGSRIVHSTDDNPIHIWYSICLSFTQRMDCSDTAESSQRRTAFLCCTGPSQTRGASLRRWVRCDPCTG